MFDLGPAASHMSRLVSGVRDDQLDDPTPCEEWAVRDLLAHIHQFTAVFTHNARKADAQPPEVLVDDWREAIPAALDDLASAWRDESAWHGRVSAGGVEMVAADNALVAVEELTTHGWDLARATEQEPWADDDSLDRIDAFFAAFGGAPFGPEVPAGEDASGLERAIARTGRAPDWQPPARG